MLEDKASTLWQQHALLPINSDLRSNSETLRSRSHVTAGRTEPVI